MPPNYVMLFPLGVRVYILFPWTRMISSNKRILTWPQRLGHQSPYHFCSDHLKCFLSGCFLLGHSLEISFHTVGCPSHMERTYAYALVNSSIRAQFSSVQVPDMRVKKHPDVSKMKPQTWWSREKTSLLFPGQNLDLPTCEHNKILFVLYHLPRAALLNSHK